MPFTLLNAEIAFSKVPRFFTAVLTPLSPLTALAMFWICVATFPRLKFSFASVLISESLVWSVLRLFDALDASAEILSCNTPTSGIQVPSFSRPGSPDHVCVAFSASSLFKIFLLSFAAKAWNTACAIACLSSSCFFFASSRFCSSACMVNGFSG